MKPSLARKKLKTQRSFPAIVGSWLLFAYIGVISLSCASADSGYRHVATVAGLQREMGEPFGIAVKGGDIYVSDGQNGRILRVNGVVSAFVEGLDTPSAIAFDQSGKLIVADAGSNTIKSIDPSGMVSNVGGRAAERGFADGEAAAALFNGPVGIAVDKNNKIYVADTYNDRIRVIENGQVSTLAGRFRGNVDGTRDTAQFDTPCGLALWNDKLLVADTGNRSIRVVEPDGRVWTLAGNGESELKDGLLYSSSFVQPTAVTVDENGWILVSDGNAIRQIGGTAIPTVRTISGGARGLKDGNSTQARFNRLSGLAIDADGNLLVADSENGLIRRLSSSQTGRQISVGEILDLRDRPGEFRNRQPARWPYDPPTAKRDIAGTLSEIRGEMKADGDEVWFHNGLDIAGAYGETARFIRDEKVLRPSAAENFGTLRELLRLPTLGYIHIRLGRNESGVPFGDNRFQFERDAAGKLAGVRVPRGANFRAGEPIGTLNSMNHVHLVAGRSGAEMNALDALILPNLTDSRPPVIEKVSVFDQNWKEIETGKANSRISLSGKSRIVIRAYDQIDGNSERRRLGVYRLGYQVLRSDGSSAIEPQWTIRFDRLPPPEAVSLVYATGSKSGATGETIFSYIASNRVDGDELREDFFDTANMQNGIYTLRVFAADYFGNTSSKDAIIEVLK